MFMKLDLFVKCALSLLLISGSLPVAQAQNLQSNSDPLGQFEEFVDFLRELRTSLDKKQFDLDELLSHLEYDAEKILAYIKQKGSTRNRVGDF